MRQSYVIEPTPDGRLQIRLVILPDIEQPRSAPDTEDGKRVIIIDPREDCDNNGVVILEM